MNTRLLTFFSMYISLTGGMLICHSQAVTPGDSNALVAKFHQAMRIAVDSTILIQQKKVDSLSQVLEGVCHQQTVSLKRHTDSLIVSAKGTLTQDRINSVNVLYKRLFEKLNSQCQTQRQSFSSQLTNYIRAITNITNIHRPYPRSSKPGDFEDAFNQFQEEIERSADSFLESTADFVDDASSMLADSSEAYRESLTTYVETLSENSSAELDSLETHSNRIITSLDGRSHASFRGRDGGVSQTSISPSVALVLASGVRFSIGAGWTDEPDFHHDGSNAGIGYDFTPMTGLSCSLGYSYLWFSDSSTQNQSVFHHSIDGSLSLETALVNLGAGIGISIGTETEYAVSASISRSISLGIFSLDPSITVSWGEQNGLLVAERTTKAATVRGKSSGKGNGKGNSGGSVLPSSTTITTTPTNVFSLMSYEANLPINIKIGRRVLLVPSLTAVIPVNIIDGSRELPYFNAGLNVTIDWLW
jgi:hypothetical protein